MVCSSCTRPTFIAKHVIYYYCVHYGIIMYTFIPTVNLFIYVLYLFYFDMSHKPDGAGCMHAGDIKVD